MRVQCQAFKASPPPPVALLSIILCSKFEMVSTKQLGTNGEMVNGGIVY